MRRIALQQLHLRNFKSFRELTVIRFNDAPGFKFMGGENIAEPRLGANGAGKTSIWDGIAWVLTGAGIRGQKASDLVSWGEKRPYGSVDLLVEDEEFTIERWGNPDQLNVAGERTDQRGVNLLLGMSRGRFLHSVIFGQGVPFFIDLSVPERGTLLDEILDLGIWAKAAELAGKQAAAKQIEVRELDRQISFAEGQLAGLPLVADLEAELAAWDAVQAGKLEAAIVLVEEAEAGLESKEIRLSKAKGALAQIDGAEIAVLETSCAQLKARIADLLVDFRVMSNKAQGVNEHLSFLLAHANCPTCKQKFPAAQRQHSIMAERKQSEDFVRMMNANGVNSNQATRTLETHTNDLNKLVRKRDFLTEQVNAAKLEYLAQLRLVDQLVQQAEKIGEDDFNPYNAQLAKAKEDRDALVAKLITTNQLRKAENAVIETYNYWHENFKRVRLFMVKRILGHLEIEVQNAANILGLDGWEIKFVTETETRSGTTRQGVQITIASPTARGSWESWSGGEGQRIRLAVALGFSNMVQRMAGVNYSFECWDEPSAWLSPEGIEDLLECLKYRATAAHKSVWLLDHRALLHSGFSEIWKVSKDKGGSRIERQV